MGNAAMVPMRDRDVSFWPGFVLVEVSAEEATEQFPEGVYIVREPTPEHGKALFESQYC
jgi:hypothetical protein